MKVIVGMATFEGREHALDKALKSLNSQVDGIYLYDNSELKTDLKDNGKFYGLSEIDEPCYYLTCDDDLHYPPDYVEKMVNAVDRYDCIITHHGRTLLGTGIHYYRGHTGYRCLGNNKHFGRIDVCGTGVTAFSTEKFNPVDLWDSEDQKMSDLIFSQEAVSENVDILVMPHAAGWIKQLPIDLSKSIYETENNNCQRQTEIADQIYTMRYGKS